MLRFIVLVLAGLTLWGGACLGAGPKAVAVADRSLWPRSMQSADDFDQASRAEILVFAKVFAEVEAAGEDWKSLTGVKAPHPDSIQRWLKQTKDVLLLNWAAAQSHCQPSALACNLGKPDVSGLGSRAMGFAHGLAPEYRAWLEMSEKFYHQYLLEQLRLAALFPTPTSEILMLSQREITGVDWPDRTFLLTFDDGPTPLNGTTDRLMPLLKQYKLNGIFFVLGDAFKARLEQTSAASIQELYKEQCVGSHGREHTSHQTLKTWKESLDFTQELVKATIKENAPRLYFRPPYAQRTAALTQYVQASGSTIMLWNLDSQDWSSKITASQVTDRMVTLMLLWRRGILLFHDVHNKVHTAVPALAQFAQATGLTWQHCRALN